MNKTGGFWPGECWSSISCPQLPILLLRSWVLQRSRCAGNCVPGKLEVLPLPCHAFQAYFWVQRFKPEAGTKEESSRLALRPVGGFQMGLCPQAAMGQRRGSVGSVGMLGLPTLLSAAQLPNEAPGRPRGCGLPR